MADTTTYHAGDSMPPPKASAVLRILYGLERGKRFELVGNEFSIGRGEEADIVLADPTISEVHAVLYLMPDNARLRDAGSAAGLRVNGRIVDDEISLRDGAQIEIGGVVLAFSYTPSEVHSEVSERASDDEERESDDEETTFTASEGGGPSVRIDTIEKQIRQVGFHRRGIRRIRIGSQRPMITQLISWFVIFTVVFTAMWVIRTILYDTVRIPEIASPVVAASVQDETPNAVVPLSGALREDDEDRTPAVDYGMSYSPSPVETPDKARRTYDAAMQAWWNDEDDETLSILRSIKRDHPDFEPPLGESLDQLIEQVEMQSQYSDAVSRAATVTVAQTATAVELKGALEGLARIPPTDQRFGPVAELYRQGIQQKLNSLPDPSKASVGSDDEVDDDVEGLDEEGADEDEDEFEDLDDDLADMALDEDGEVVEEPLPEPLDGRTLMAQAGVEARRLYEEGRHKDAARLYGLLRREDGLTGNQRAQCRYLERKLLYFGVAFEEGIDLVDDPATARRGIRRLEGALAADRVLFRFYERLLGKQIASAHAVLALEALDRADLVHAGEHMERGLERAPHLSAWDEIKPRVAAMAMEHLDRARAGLDADAVRARRILKQVVAAAPVGSPAWEESSALLEALDRDDAKPSLPAEATF